jgi:1-acyl-sn-glycerol-3-phosphate acyltransferase
VGSLTRFLLPSFVRSYQPGDEVRVEPPPAEYAERILRFFDRAEERHRYAVRGLEHVPREGGALLVSPHSFLALDMFLLGKRIFERDRRIVRGLTDHVVFKIPGLRDLFSTLGIVDGTQENGLRLLASGQLAACMPGGALEWSRSSRLRRRMRWSDHRGYARLAIRAGVPIVPTACPAADDLYYVAVDGWTTGLALQRAFGLRRVWPIPLFLGLGPLPFPVTLTQYVGEPLWPIEAGSEEERVLELDERVRRVLADMLAGAA